MTDLASKKSSMEGFAKGVHALVNISNDRRLDLLDNSLLPAQIGFDLDVDSRFSFCHIVAEQMLINFDCQFLPADDGDCIGIGEVAGVDVVFGFDISR